MCQNCNNSTLLRGNGITSVVDNGDGTFTFNFSDGSTFTTSDLTGPTGATGPAGPAGANGANGAKGANGANGADGADGTAVLIADMTAYTTGPGQPDFTYTIDTTQFVNHGDGIFIHLLTNTEDIGMGNFGGGDLELEVIGGAPLTVESLFTHTYDAGSATNGLIEIYMFKDGVNMQGTHVQTADERILPGGTAYITDVGMTGPQESVIGIEKDQIIERFLSLMPRKYDVADGKAVLSTVLVQVDDRSGRSDAIRRLQLTHP